MILNVVPVPVKLVDVVQEYVQFEHGFEIVKEAFVPQVTEEGIPEIVGVAAGLLVLLIVYDCAAVQL